MPNYQTPEPISVVIELNAADVTITASDQTDTAVEIRPHDETDESDVEAAQQVRVDHTSGTLHVKGPKRLFDFSRKTRSVAVCIELPAGSDVSASVQLGAIRCSGRLGECRLKTGAGDIWVERAGSLRSRTGLGEVTAGDVAGDAEVSTGSGSIQVGEVQGAAVIENSNGKTSIAAVGGALRVKNANGEIRVGRAESDVVAKSSNGSIRIGEVTRGVLVVGTAMGDLDIGIAEGTAAWLDVNTSHGRVESELDRTPQPSEADETVEVRGRTACGDIIIRRSRSSRAAA